MTSAWVVTSSAVVGSSASRSRGPIAQRRGDHHSLQQAARELVRVLAEPAFGVRDADVREEAHHAASRPRPVSHAVIGDQRLGEEVADACAPD